MLTQYTPPFRRINPLLQMRHMQNDLSRAIGGLRLAPPQIDFPTINIWANSDGAILTAEVPGVAPEDLDIAVHQDTVTLRGKRDPEPLPQDAVVHRAERATGRFARSFTLPFRIDPDGVNARFKQGVLTLELPRPEEEKPKRIQVQRA
jgi:HSP20 family protein